MFKQASVLIVVFRFRTRIITALTPTITTPELLQLSPLQLLHAATHVKPFFLHYHKFVPQVIWEVVLQLRRTKFNNSFGAGSRSVSWCTFHPRSNGSALVVINASHCITCRWTQGNDNWQLFPYINWIA